MEWGLVVGHNRLFAAADFLLKAVERRDPQAPALLEYAQREDWRRPPPTRSFTRRELAAAAEMLGRLGLIAKLRG